MTTSFGDNVKMFAGPAQRLEAAHHRVLMRYHNTNDADEQGVIVHQLHAQINDTPLASHDKDMMHTLLDNPDNEINNMNVMHRIVGEGGSLHNLYAAQINDPENPGYEPTLLASTIQAAGNGYYLHPVDKALGGAMLSEAVYRNSIHGADNALTAMFHSKRILQKARFFYQQQSKWYDIGKTAGAGKDMAISLGNSSTSSDQPLVMSATAGANAAPGEELPNPGKVDLTTTGGGDPASGLKRKRDPPAAAPTIQPGGGTESDDDDGDDDDDLDDRGRRFVPGHTIKYDGIGENRRKQAGKVNEHDLTDPDQINYEHQPPSRLSKFGHQALSGVKSLFSGFGNYLNSYAEDYSSDYADALREPRSAKRKAEEVDVPKNADEPSIPAVAIRQPETSIGVHTVVGSANEVVAGVKKKEVEDGVLNRNIRDLVGEVAKKPIPVIGDEKQASMKGRKAPKPADFVRPSNQQIDRPAVQVEAETVNEKPVAATKRVPVKVEAAEPVIETKRTPIKADSNEPGVASRKTEAFPLFTAKSGREVKELQAKLMAEKRAKEAAAATTPVAVAPKLVTSQAPAHVADQKPLIADLVQEVSDAARQQATSPTPQRRTSAATTAVNGQADEEAEILRQAQEVASRVRANTLQAPLATKPVNTKLLDEPRFKVASDQDFTGLPKLSDARNNHLKEQYFAEHQRSFAKTQSALKEAYKRGDFDSSFGVKAILGQRQSLIRNFNADAKLHLDDIPTAQQREEFLARKRSVYDPANDPADAYAKKNDRIDKRHERQELKASKAATQQQQQVLPPPEKPVAQQVLSRDAAPNRPPPAYVKEAPAVAPKPDPKVVADEKAEYEEASTRAFLEKAGSVLARRRRDVEDALHVQSEHPESEEQKQQEQLQVDKHVSLYQNAILDHRNATARFKGGLSDHSRAAKFEEASFALHPDVDRKLLERKITVKPPKPTGDPVVFAHNPVKSIKREPSNFFEDNPDFDADESLLDEDGPVATTVKEVRTAAIAQTDPKAFTAQKTKKNKSPVATTQTAGASNRAALPAVEEQVAAARRSSRIAATPVAAGLYADQLAGIPKVTGKDFREKRPKTSGPGKGNK